MCLICKDYILGKLTKMEALRNIGELINNDSLTEEELDHIKYVMEKLNYKELSKEPVGFPTSRR